MNKDKYELQEPFKTAFERGEASIDYRLVKGAPKTDHSIVKNLGYEIKGRSDQVLFAEELPGLRLSSWGDWGSLQVDDANDTVKDLFLQMCSDNIIEPWRIREYIKVDGDVRVFDYDDDTHTWQTYDDTCCKWISTESPYTRTH